MMFILEVLKRTPSTVWFLMAFLIYRGVRAARDGEISFGKMLIVPLLFTAWGLEKLFTQFHHLGISLGAYVLFAALGTAVGYALYSRHRTVYRSNGRIFRSGTYLPMGIMLINFFVKYALNVGMSIDPALYDSLPFCVLYSIVCGFSVGLFFGGIAQVVQAAARVQGISVK